MTSQEAYLLIKEQLRYKNEEKNSRDTYYAAPSPESAETLEIAFRQLFEKNAEHYIDSIVIE